MGDDRGRGKRKDKRRQGRPPLSSRDFAYSWKPFPNTGDDTYSKPVFRQLDDEMDDSEERLVRERAKRRTLLRRSGADKYSRKKRKNGTMRAGLPVTDPIILDSAKRR